jgi:HTH-like domain
VLGQHRSSQRRVARTPDDEAALTGAIVELARRYGRYGYRRITALLRHAGWSVNRKRVERIWRREGLKVPAKQPKRDRLWRADGSCIRLRPERPNQVWARAGTSTISRGAEVEASGPGARVLPLNRPTPILKRRPPASGGPDMAWLTTPGILVVAFVLMADRHAAPELEALLPTTLGGVSLTIESQAGTDLATESAAFDAFLASLGKSRADFTLASAYSPGGLKAAVGAWRVKGADSALLLPGFATAVQASSTTTLTQVEEIVAGRAVNRIGDPGQLTQGPLYVFVRGDTLWFVQTTERALAEEAMSKLPE